jgi:hypothetical protein
MKFVYPWRAGAAACVAAFLAAGCGGGESPSGSVRFALTDAPACGFDQVNITVERIRVHRSANAGDNEVGWSELRLNPAKKIDLLKLQNGVLEDLGQLPLSSGQYTQLRLVLASASGSGAPANSVVPVGGSERALTVPSGTQTGIKLIHPFSVSANNVADVVLDFDACRSIVRAGASGNYLLKPVVKVVPRTGTAISGYVDPAVNGVTVSAQKAGVVLRSTAPDAGGRFVIAFLDPAQSPFDVVASANGRTTAVVSGVPLTSTASTEVSRADAPITLPEAATRTAGGTVGPMAVHEIAAVRAMQAVGGVPRVEVARVNVDASSGNYSLALPIVQARIATYSTTLPLTFNGGGNAARYTLDAFADGYVAQSRAIDLTTDPATWSPTLVPQ